MILNNPVWTTLILVAVSVSSIIGVILVGRWVYKKGPLSKQRQRMTDIAVDPNDDVKKTSVRDSFLPSKQDVGKFRDWLNRTLSSFSSKELQLKLSSAYWPVTDVEFILLRITATIAASLIGWLIPGNILGGIFAGVIVFMAPAIFLDRAIARRQKKFHDQLLDVLILIKGAVQAGYGLMQALDLAVDEVPAPASEEFGRILSEVRLGISLEAALNNLSERMENDDLQIVVTAIIINAQVGGKLSTVLESAIDTIRDRMHLMGEIRSLTSYSKYVGNFLTLLPFIAGLAIFMISPDYFSTVQTSLITQIIFAAAFIGVVMGNIWIRQLVKIKV